MIRTRFPAPAMACSPSGRGRLRGGLGAALVVLSAGCRENLSAPPSGSGPDVSGPLVSLHPSHDTTVDSTGTLLIRLDASDRSGVQSVAFFLLPATATFPVLTPNDTVFSASYPVPLGIRKHGTFRYYARTVDVLGHETVTDSVTVTVR